MIDTGSPLETLKYGEAAFSLVGRGEPQVAFLVRERTAVIKYFGDTGIEIRGGFFPIGQVIVTTVVFRVGRYVNHEYATWWDYHREGCAGIFYLMTGQDYLSFHFHGDNLRTERTFVSSNPLMAFFAEAVAEIRKLSPWHQGDFHEALIKVRARIPTPLDLWNTLD